MALPLCPLTFPSPNRTIGNHHMLAFSHLVLMIRNSETVYPVHVILECLGQHKGDEVHEGKENVTSSNKNIEMSRRAKMEVVPYLLCGVRAKETVLNGLLPAGAQQRRLIKL